MSERRLTPDAIAKRLFVINPDRDERASQLCIETLLTLAQNGYAAPSEGTPLAGPKRRRFALRSLALGVNFLQGAAGLAGADHYGIDQYGEDLSKGDDIRGASNLPLAQRALEGLIDPSTQRGQKGSWLAFPFHEALLWYDARKAEGTGWRVRKVYMRGSGITLARLLLDPAVEEQSRQRGQAAVIAVRNALWEPSPLATLAEKLEAPLLSADAPEQLEDDEREAWDAGTNPRLSPLARSLTLHADGVLRQGGASGPGRLWQLRTILGLDLACHALRSAWEAVRSAPREQYLLLSFEAAARSENVVRQRSEDSYQVARIRLRQAIAHTLATEMASLAEQGRDTIDWKGEFESRSGLEDIAKRLSRDQSPDFAQLALEAAERANYDRSGEGFRVLLESIGMIAGTRYRFLTATPDLLAAFAGALSTEMPMPSDQFFSRVFDEWGVVISPDAAAGTDLYGRVDGADLARNARAAEQVLIEAGLAVGLSDRTTLVGERLRRMS